MTKDTAVMFTGVNEGYKGEEVAIKDPQQAVDIVNHRLSSIKETTQDSNEYTVLPGVVVYNEGWGCPKGGEVVAAVITNGEPESAIKTAESLREELKQSTLSVGTYEGEHGEKTRGFKIEVAGNLTEVATAWQEAAYEAAKFTDPYSPTDVYVSAGMYDKGDGKIIIQAEANPAFVKDMDAWEAQTSNVAQIVEKNLGAAVKPEFIDAGFTYLQKPKEITPPTAIAEGEAQIVENTAQPAKVAQK